MVPDNVTFSSEKNWVVANNTDSARLTVTVYNQTTPLNSTKISFSVNNSDYGSLNPINISSIIGIATTNFITAHKSGTARITATIYYRINDSDLSEPEKTLIKTWDQKIDHDSIIYGTYSFNSSATVGTAVPLSFMFLDKWGNPVDNRRNKDPLEHLSPEQLRFEVSLPDGNHTDRAGFWDGTIYVVDTTIDLDNEGKVAKDLQLDTLTGAHYIHATPINFIVKEWLPSHSTVSKLFFEIQGIANGEPWGLDRVISPSVYWVYADGIQYFTIDYVLTDRYGNGLENSGIDVSTLEQVSGTETRYNTTVYTNSYGEATVTYGPKQKMTSWITSSATGNQSLRYVDVVEFKNTTPADMLLTATPQTLASRDAVATSYANVSAKVMDEQGAGTPGQTVTFTLINYTFPAYSIAKQPQLYDIDGIHNITASAVTDDDGYATIQFYPGYFNTTQAKNATVYTDVRAQWQIPNTTSYVNQTVRITWKNYPYLSVVTSVSPETVNVTDTVDVTIYLKGDGYAFSTYKPIDVMMCTDRSGSMLLNSTGYSAATKYDQYSVVSESSDDRMVLAMRAQVNFIKQMNTAQDKLGLVSFGGIVKNDVKVSDSGYTYWAGQDYIWKKIGWPGTWQWTTYSDDDNAYILKNYPGNGKTDYTSVGNLDKGLTANFIANQLCDIVNNTIPAGGTPTRNGIWRAVKELDSKSTNDIKAVILLTDGGWNTGGDPRGLTQYDYDGAYQTLADFSSEGGPAGGTVDPSGGKSVITWAKNHGIRIYTIAVGNESQTTVPELQAYADETNGTFHNAQSADQLVGVYDEIAKALQEEAGADVYTNLTFDEVEVDNIAIPATDEFNYVPADRSTLIKQYHNKTGIWDQKVVDQSEEWTAGSLNYSIGKMLVDDIWQATFRLRVTNETGGNIKIFSPDYEGSYISFINNGVLNKLLLPDTYITAKANLTSQGIQQATLKYESTSDPITVISNDQLRFTWERNYTGTKQLMEVYEVSIDNGMTWVTVGERSLSGTDAKNPDGEFILDLTNLPSSIGSINQAGGIEFRVTGRASDVGSPEYWKPPRFILQQPKGRILLE